MTPKQFETLLYSLPYDKLCQDIEYINLIGHSKSHITWNLMKDMFDWKGKRVADLGCFHGYYCFKAEQEGAIVTGFDQAQSILDVTATLAKAMNSNLKLTLWKGGDPISSEYDISLLLSVLYFFPDQEKALQNIHSKYLLCDVADNSLPLINKYYKVLQRKESWGRDVRNGIGNLMLCEKK